MSISKITRATSEHQSPAITNAGAPFDNPDADVILRSIDNVDFRVFKLLMSLASPFFKTMFALPQSGEDHDRNEKKDGLPVVQFTEKKKTLERLLMICYPMDLPVLEELEDVQSLLDVAMKYNVERAEKKATEWLFAPRFLEQDPVRVFTIACHHRMKEKALVAAKSTLGRPILERPYGRELEYISGGQLYCLLQYHKKITEATTKVAAKPFTWIKQFDWYRYCPSCGTASIHIALGGSERAELKVNSWWYDYTQGVAAALKDEKWDVAKKRALMERTLGKALKCKTCAPNAKDEMRVFENMLMAKIDEVSSKVGVSHTRRHMAVSLLLLDSIGPLLLAEGT